MHRTIFASGLLALALALPSGASATTTVGFDQGSGADGNFTALCGGLDCEFTVGEVRAGNRASNGDWEVGFFDRLSDTETTSQAAPFSTTGTATISYLAATTTLTLTAFNTTVTNVVDLGETNNGANNPAGAAQSLVIRVRNATLSNLLLTAGGVTDHPITDAGVLSALDQEVSGDVGYAYLGFDMTADWSFSTDFTLDGTSNGSGSAFQFKITDLDPAPIPVPAALPLLAAGIGALGLMRRARRA